MSISQGPPEDSKDSPPPVPRAPRPVPEGPYHDRPLPLLRCTHTVCVPWDDNPITFEMIVLPEGMPVDYRTVTVADLPELKEAGWSNRCLGSVNVFTRLVW